jgi:hypothetical protein
MAGQIKRMIDQIIAKRANGNNAIVATTKTKLIMKGINPDKYTLSSEDDPQIISKLNQIANDLGINL